MFWKKANTFESNKFITLFTRIIMLAKQGSQLFLFWIRAFSNNKNRSYICWKCCRNLQWKLLQEKIAIQKTNHWRPHHIDRRQMNLKCGFEFYVESTYAWPEKESYRYKYFSRNKSPFSVIVRDLKKYYRILSHIQTLYHMLH